MYSCNMINNANNIVHYLYVLCNHKNRIGLEIERKTYFGK